MIATMNRHQKAKTATDQASATSTRVTPAVIVASQSRHAAATVEDPPDHQDGGEEGDEMRQAETSHHWFLMVGGVGDRVKRLQRQRPFATAALRSA